MDAHNDQVGVAGLGEAQNTFGWEFETDDALDAAPILCVGRDQLKEPLHCSRADLLLMLHRNERDQMSQCKLRLILLSQRKRIRKCAERALGEVSCEHDVAERRVLVSLAHRSRADGHDWARGTTKHLFCVRAKHQLLQSMPPV